MLTLPQLRQRDTGLVTMNGPGKRMRLRCTERSRKQVQWGCAEAVNDASKSPECYVVEPRKEQSELLLTGQLECMTG